MENQELIPVSIETLVHAPLEKVWNAYTAPEHITKWNQASEDWHTPHAENDLRPGGRFKNRMEAKDGSFGFDFEGVYDDVEENRLIAYTMPDGRKVRVNFYDQNNLTRVLVVFEPESTNPRDMQEQGWQAILESFKRYTEEL